MKKVLLIILFFTSISYSCYAQEYAIANSFCPVLNLPEFKKVFGGEDGKTIKLNDQNFIEELEFIAYPGSVFEIKNIIYNNGYRIFEVITNEYPYDNTKLYIDSRFTDIYTVMPFDRKPEPYTKEQIIEHLKTLEGTPYLWGGNYSAGIKKMTDYYKPTCELDEHIKSIWNLEGVDCSGLLYEATGGTTPRNTSSLIFWGEPLDIEGKDKESILGIIEPLDLIVWDGHVLIVIDEGYIIESSPITGVKRARLERTLEKIMEERKPFNFWDKNDGKRFVVRRWIN